MPGNKSNNSKRDLSNSSAVLRNDNASDKARGIAGQNLANHRWEQEYKRQVQEQRTSTTRDKTRGR